MSQTLDSEQVIPTSYASWKHCITVHCGMPLTAELARARIAELENPDAEEARRFVRCYGETHYQRVLDWWRRVLAEQG